MKKKLTVDVFTDTKCPAWAMYAAVDADGTLYLYGGEPSLEPTAGEWHYYESDHHYCWFDADYDASDWENSLIERPETKEERKETIMTSYERLKQMTKDDLAAFLANTDDTCDFCADKGKACGSCYDGIRRWLNSPVKIDEGYPDWAMPGNWVYNKKLDEYAKIDVVTDSGVSFMGREYVTNKMYFLEAFTEAEYRPYTVVELAALVGEKLERGDSVCLVTAYNKQEGFIVVNQTNYNADELLASDYRYKNHPCGIRAERIVEK